MGPTYVFVLSKLDEVFEKLTQGLSMLQQQQRVPDTTKRTQVGKKALANSLGDGCAPEAPLGGKEGTLLASWLCSSSMGLLMLQTS